MGITIEILKLDLETKVCIVKVYDGVECVISEGNIGIELNNDGTANLDWLKNQIEAKVFGHRELKRNRRLSVNLDQEN